MWKDAVWPNWNIPRHVWREWQRSLIRAAGLRAAITPPGPLNAKQQWLQIDATVGPVNTHKLTSFSSITNNPCSIWRHRPQSPMKVSHGAKINVCVCMCCPVPSRSLVQGILPYVLTSQLSYLPTNQPNDRQTDRTTDRQNDFYVTNSIRRSHSWEANRYSAGYKIICFDIIHSVVLDI
jgi:hypothetical protein